MLDAYQRMKHGDYLGWLLKVWLKRCVDADWSKGPRSVRGRSCTVFSVTCGLGLHLPDPGSGLKVFWALLLPAFIRKITVNVLCGAG